MEKVTLQAQERKVLGKKVKVLRKNGQLPGHVFGKGVDGESVTVEARDFLKTFTEVGETGLVDLRIGSKKVRPVLIRDVAYDPITGAPIHVDFYQVNLSKKVTVSVPIELIGEEPEKVHLGEAIVLQTLNEVEVEALPTDLIEKIEVDISSLKEVDDAISVGDLPADRDKITINADAEEIVVKLAPAVTAEMEQILEEQAAQTAEAQAQAAAAEGAEVAVEGEAEEAPVGEGPAKQEAAVEAGEQTATPAKEPKQE